MSDSQLSVQVLKERTYAVVRGMIWVDANKFEHMSVTISNGEVVEISNEDMWTCGIMLMNWLLSLLNSTVAACQRKKAGNHRHKHSIWSLRLSWNDSLCV